MGHLTAASRRALDHTRHLVLGLVVIAVTILAEPAAATPFDPRDSGWEGSKQFVDLAQAELGRERVRVESRLGLESLRPGDALILLHPEGALPVESLARFMKAGGRVVLLDDYGTGDELLEHFSIRRVPAPRKPVATLRHNPELAMAEPAGAHPTVTDVSRVVTNHPTGLAHAELSPVLKIPSEKEDVLIALAGAVGRGRLIAVGDSSIVMNQMMRYPGNQSFARGLVRYSAEDDTWGRRTGNLYIAIGNFELTGVFGEDDGPRETLLRQWRELRDALANARRDGLPPRVLYLLAIFTGLALVTWVARRATRTHQASRPRFVRGVPLVAQGGIAGHAALLAARGTPRALALLELKSALEEDIAAVLGLERLPPSGTLGELLAERGLFTGEDVVALKRLLLRLSNVETLVLSQRARLKESIAEREVVSVANAVQEIRKKIRGLTNSTRGPSDVRRPS